MKRFSAVVSIIVLLALAAGAAAQDQGAQRQALRLAVEKAQSSLARAGALKNANISLLPMSGSDAEYVEGLLKNAVTAAGLKYVEGKQDPMWDAIIEEIAWSGKKGDMLDQKTLSSFGRLQGTQLLLYGSISAEKTRADSGYVELELHITSIATKEHLWGGVFSHRYYGAGELQGIVELDPELRQALKNLFAANSGSLKNSAAAKKIKSALVVPLAGDIDGYVTGLAVDMFSGLGIAPRELDVATLGEARLLLRDTPEPADAVLYGAVRDLSRELDREEVLKDTYEINVDVQLRLQDAQTGDILWSDTFIGTFQDLDERSEEEIALGLLKKYPQAPLYALGGVLALIVLMVLIKKATRVR
jgi:PBP1b-binding outer membrane lipoprotein LpoB